MATVGGKLERLSIDSLLLDPQNPRLPDDKRGTSDQLALAAYIAKRYKPIEIGQSVAANGFFESEPLIAVKDNGKYIVKEGNRRLTALKGLADTAYRLRYPRSKEWDGLAKEIARKELLPGKLPVVVAADEDSVWPIIGYRHVSGIEPWAPLAKANFIGQRVDAGETWEQVAILVGESETSVRSHYRNLRVARQMRDEYKIDTSETRGQLRHVHPSNDFGPHQGLHRRARSQGCLDSEEPVACEQETAGKGGRRVDLWYGQEGTSAAGVTQGSNDAGLDPSRQALDEGPSRNRRIRTKGSPSQSWSEGDPREALGERGVADADGA